MTLKYKKFIFDSYSFNKINKTLILNYSLDDLLHFTETYVFDFEFVDYDPARLDRAIQGLFFMSGISYFKAFFPSQIEVRSGQLDSKMSNFFSKIYKKGLGEFFYVNKLDPNANLQFPANSSSLPSISTPSSMTGMLVGIGGGKDSLLSIELLKQQGLPNIVTWSLNHKSQLEPQIKRIGLKHLWVKRTIDPQLIELNKHGALNGHIPISAIFATCGIVTAILVGKNNVVVSNEHSANEPTLYNKNIAINHQYSKSQEFEKDFQEYLNSFFGQSLSYYSLLRPFSELYIAELFSKICFNKYSDVFSSCNKAFTQKSTSIFWCGKCSKCAFVFMLLSPFIERTKLENIWGNKNLLLDQSLIPIYKQLLGIEGTKPFECVGEIQESRQAMLMCFKIYPNLPKIYNFPSPINYNYRQIYNSLIPPQILTDLLKII